MTKEPKRTICWLIEDLKDFGSIKGNIGIIARLDEIQYKASRMEDRLLEYCNTIEDLGFERVGRDCNNQWFK